MACCVLCSFELSVGVEVAELSGCLPIGQLIQQVLALAQ